MKKIAITGGIGSGKTTVLNILKSMGYTTFSCDQIYTEVLLDKEYIEKISIEFPTAVINGNIDKKQLANIIFADEEKRKLLDGIAHPMIMHKLEKKMMESASDIVFAEVPLLFEGGFYKRFDEIIVVQRDKEERVQAIILRDSASEADVLDRMNAQFDYYSKEGNVFIQKIGAKILYNNGTLENLKHDLNLIIEDLA